MDWFDFLLFSIVSSLEYVADLIFIAVLFRFRYFLKMKTQIIMVCLLLSYVSYTTRTVYELGIGSTVIQLGLMTLFIWLLFRVQVFYAMLMAITGHVAYGAAQTLLAFLFTSLNIFSLSDLAILKWPSHILPIITSIIFYAISWIINRKNWGFSFVPDGFDTYFNWKGRILFTLSFLSLFFLLLSILHGVGYTMISNVYIASIVYIAAFAFIMIYSIRRERNND